VVLLFLQPATAEQVRVRYAEGLVHGFLVLRDLDGTTLAHGDLIQTTRGTRVVSRLVFHFRDGSLHDETTVFTTKANRRSNPRRWSCRPTSRTASS
jgi:hypothetical protein